MKLKFFGGLILLALTFGARAQFTSNSISGISPSSAFGTNAPGAVVVTGGIDLFQIAVSGGGNYVTTNNIYYFNTTLGFYTNTLGTNITYLVNSNALAALGYSSKPFAAICYPPAGTNLNLLYTNAANSLISTNWVKAATAGTNPAPVTAYQIFTSPFFGGHGSVAAGSTFGTNAPGWITNVAGFTGTAGRVGVITIQTNLAITALGACTNIAIYGDTTNFLARIPFGGIYYYAGLGRTAIYNQLVPTFTNTVRFSGNATNLILCTFYVPDTNGYASSLVFTGSNSAGGGYFNGVSGSWPNFSLIQFQDGQENSSSGVFATTAAAYSYTTNYP